MKLIDRLIWRELVGPVTNSVFMFVMVIFASTSLFKITELLGQGVPFGAVIEVTIYGLPSIITQTLPMAMLLGCLLAFGRLSGDSENIALFASGISFTRVARPVAMMGLCVSVLAVAWNEMVVPPATRAYYRAMQKATGHLRASTQPLNYAVMRQDGSGRVDEFVNINGGLDARNRTLRQVTITKMSDDPKRQGMPDYVVYAEKVVALDNTGTTWEYYNVSGQPFLADPASKTMAYFNIDQATTLPAKNVKIGRDFGGIMKSDTEERDNRRMTFVSLFHKIQEMRAQGALDTLTAEMDLWEKLSLPLASLIFGLVGAPLGIRPQRGSKAMGFGVAIGIIFVYWVIYHGMFMVGQRGQLPPALASFTADFIGIVGAALLISRTRQ